MLSSKNNTNNRSQIKIMSTEGHQRDFMISRERDSFAASRGFSTINSNKPPKHVPGSQVLSTRNAASTVKVPTLLTNKNASNILQNDFMALRNSRKSNKDFDEGRRSAFTAHGQLAGGLRSKPGQVITNGEQLKVQ
jgi:hypothetical protein